MVTIGHASLDERGKASGGAAGDQTGREVCTRSWYNKGWNKLIRAKSSTVAEKIAKAMEQACANNNIGYDQLQRTTLYTYALAAGWDLSKIKIKCETDCSALVAVCVNAAGVRVSKDIYTGNEAASLKATGKFDVLTDSKYLTTDAYLKRGDILLKEGSHTAIVLSNGAGTSTASKTSGALNKSVKWTGKVTETELNVRTYAGKENNTVSFSPLKKGSKVGVCDTVKASNGAEWYYISYNGKYGFCSAKYIKKV